MTEDELKDQLLIEFRGKLEKDIQFLSTKFKYYRSRMNISIDDVVIMTDGEDDIDDVVDSVKKQYNQDRDIVEKVLEGYTQEELGLTSYAYAKIRKSIKQKIYDRKKD